MICWSFSNAQIQIPDTLNLTCRIVVHSCWTFNVRRHHLHLRHSGAPIANSVAPPSHCSAFSYASQIPSLYLSSSFSLIRNLNQPQSYFPRESLSSEMRDMLPLLLLLRLILSRDGSNLIVWDLFLWIGESWQMLRCLSDKQMAYPVRQSRC
jgi:hypothetical protein